MLQIRLNVRNLLLFMIFFFAMHEWHELAHIITGRLICGCWGSRDFNVWDLCDDCLRRRPLAILAALAGPLFTFTMLWIGNYRVRRGRSVRSRSVGLLLILGNMQFGRIYMAATGSGDEVWAMRHLFLNPDHSNAGMIRIITCGVVALICVPPLVTAWRVIVSKRKMLVFAGFLILPLILDTVVILIVLNGLLQKGFLSQVWIMHTPVLVTAWFAACMVVLALNWRSLTRFADLPQTGDRQSVEAA